MSASTALAADLDLLGMHTWTWEIASNTVSWSTGVERLVGLPPGAFGGTFEAYQRVLHPDDRDAVLRAVSTAIEQPDAGYDVEHRVVLPDGTVRWLSCRGRVVRDEHGAPLRMHGIVFEVTARKEAEARMARLLRFSKVVAGVNEEIVRVTDERQLFERACRIAIERGGLRFAWIGVLDDTGTAVVPAARWGHEDGYLTDVRIVLDDPLLGRGPTGTAVREGKHATCDDLEIGVEEFPWRRRALERGYRSSAAFPFVSGGKVRGTINLYAELPRAFDDEELTLFDGLAEDIGLALDRLHEVAVRKALEAQLVRADRLASLGRLAGGVAHEINNPLAYVLLNLELMQKELPTLSPSAGGRFERALTESLHGAERVRRIVRGLAEFSRGEEEPLKAVDVNAALDAAIHITENRIRHRARLVRRFEASRPALANEFRLGQVFVNLLVNAADAIPEGDVEHHEITVTTRQGLAGIVVEVSDTGTGIAAEAREHLFDPFFTTKSVGMGTGLGLSICHSIVTSFGGTISVESEPGRGATFQVVLPVATSRSDAPRADGSSTRPAAVRVLVVDDEPAITRVISALLSDHDVTVASNGRDARQLCATESFDCILCDVMMPDMSGPDIHAALREDGRGLERRIVFMTGGAFTPRAREFLASVENPCLDKPFSPTTLEDAISAVTRNNAH